MITRQLTDKQVNSFEEFKTSNSPSHNTSLKHTTAKVDIIHNIQSGGKMHCEPPVLPNQDVLSLAPLPSSFWKRNENFIYFLHLASRHSFYLARKPDLTHTSIQFEYKVVSSAHKAGWDCYRNIVPACHSALADCYAKTTCTRKQSQGPN